MFRRTWVTVTVQLTVQIELIMKRRQTHRINISYMDKVGADVSRARICKRLRIPGIDSEEWIPPGWEPIPRLLKRFTNTRSDLQSPHL